MTDYPVDIIVPVWNQPVATRSCLADLLATTAGARFILINNGSDRETEQVLHDFAEHLDCRALLISSPVNRGMVNAINRGLSRVEAPLAVTIRPGGTVAEGWLQPLLKVFAEVPAAGLVVPRLENRKPNPARGGVAEVDHGSFAAMAFRKALIERIGGFDEEMDNDLWCLRDYSRRAYRAGFLTFEAGCSLAPAPPAPQLGSSARRGEASRRSQACYDVRWGRPETFFVDWTSREKAANAAELIPHLLRGARQGHRIFVLLHPSLREEVLGAGGHENLRLELAPRLFSRRFAQRRRKELLWQYPELVAVAATDLEAGEGAEQDVASLLRLIDRTAEDHYTPPLPAAAAPDEVTAKKEGGDNA